MTNLEFKEFTRFRETKVANGFEPWPPVNTSVRIKSGKFTGCHGIILHQTTRHRFGMMIHLPSAGIDVLCRKNELEVVK